MTLEDRIAKLEFQISLISGCLNNTLFSVDVNSGWGEKELTLAHDIIEKYYDIYTETKVFDIAAFEKDFNDSLGMNEIDLDFAMLGFHENSQWIELCDLYRKQKEL